MNDFDMNNEYTNEDFDNMLIPLYREDGYPWLDQFEYIYAIGHNEDVERQRKEYFQRKADMSLK